MDRVILKSVVLVLVLVYMSEVKSEPPVQNSGGGWGQMSGTYSQGYNQQSSGGYQGSGGYQAPQVQNNNGGWGQPQPQVNNGGGGGGWGQQVQAQPQSGGGGGWGQQQQQQQQPQKQGGGNGWGQSNSPSTKDNQGGNNGWGPSLSIDIDTANLGQALNPATLARTVASIPRRIVKFIRESGLYLLFIPLIIILPLMLLAFNAGRLVGGSGWGWSAHGKRSLASTMESQIVGYLKSPIWQKIGETLMDEHVFDSIMKSVDKFKETTKNKKNW